MYTYIYIHTYIYGVCELLTKMTSNFQVSADALEAKSIDGNCLMKMLDTSAELLTTKRIEERGLGF